MDQPMEQLDARGVSDTVGFDGTRIVISPRRGAGAGYRRRLTSKEIPLDSLSGVEAVPATFWQYGSVRFVVDSSRRAESRGLYGALVPAERLAHLHDENSVNFQRRHAATFDAFVAAVRASIDRTKSQ
jgi:uncharacterized protein DUF4429